jgi:ketosteroid isomerase-like protein
MSESNEEIAVAYLKALVEGDAVQMERLLTDDFVNHDRGTARISGRRSREEVVAFTAAVPSLFKERLRFEYESITAEADRVVCQVKGYSTLPDGREYNNEYIYLFHIRDGAIYHMDCYYDTKLADERVMEVMEEQDLK